MCGKHRGQHLHLKLYPRREASSEHGEAIDNRASEPPLSIEYSSQLKMKVSPDRKQQTRL